MTKKIVIFLAVASLFSTSVLAENTTSVNQANTNQTSVNEASGSQTNVNLDDANNPLKDYYARKEKYADAYEKDPNVPAAEDYGNDLSVLVDTNEDNYESLLEEAERILDDDSTSRTDSKQEAITNNLAEEYKSNVQTNHKTIGEVSDAAKKIIKDDHNIDKDFKKSHDYYKGKTTDDYIGENVKKYDDNYTVGDYKDLLDDVKTPGNIEDSFNQIDNSQDENSKYKLNDGYPIEQITTVGLLTGQNKRLKKCLLLKPYGGGTWRTYCQPLKKPTQCSDYDWQQLTTMAIMYC